MGLIQRTSGSFVSVRFLQVSNKKIHHRMPAVLPHQCCGGEDAQEDPSSGSSHPSPRAKPSTAGSSSLASVVSAGDGYGQPCSPCLQGVPKHQSRWVLKVQDHSRVDNRAEQHNGGLSGRPQIKRECKSGYNSSSQKYFKNIVARFSLAFSPSVICDSQALPVSPGKNNLRKNRTFFLFLTG